jgi:ATP-dependent Clp protease protease subunit
LRKAQIVPNFGVQKAGNCKTKRLHLNKRTHFSSGEKRARIYAKAGGSGPLLLSIVAKGTTAHIEIEGDISEYGGTSAIEFKAQVTNLMAQGIKDAHVYINSFGGDVFQANQIVNEIQRFEGRVTGEGGAVVASAATYIAIHLQSFTMAMNGMFMIHKPYGGFYGTASEIESSLKLLKDLEGAYLAKYAEKTGKTEAAIAEIWNKGDWWMTAQEALDESFISGITEITEISPELAAQMTAKGAPNVVATAKAPIPEPPKQTSKSNKPHNVKELQILALSMGLSEDASLAEIKAEFAKVKALAARATKAEQDLEDLKKAEGVKAKAAAKTLFTAAFDAKLNAKAVTEEYRAGLTAKFEANPEAALAEVAAFKPAPTLSGDLGDGAPPVEDLKTFAEYQTKNPKALFALAKADPAKFKALYTAQYGAAPSDSTINAMAEQA